MVEDLSRDLPSLKTFVTLSPAPGFGRWLKRVAAPTPTGLGGSTPTRWRVSTTPIGISIRPLRNNFARSCCVSLQPITSRPRAKNGQPLDPVARFHLGNGARLERLNWLGDTSAKGLREAAGLMVNYLYDLNTIETNHEAYANQGTVAASPAVQRRLGELALQPAPEAVDDLRISSRSFAAAFPPISSKIFLERPDGSILTYADLRRSLGPLGAMRSRRLGVKPGDRVAAQVEKSAEALLALSRRAARRRGLPAAELRLHAGEVRYFLGDAEPTLFVCRPASSARDESACRELGVPQVETLGQHGDGSLMDKAACERRRVPTMSTRTRQTISRPFSTPRARPAAPRAPCSATAISHRTPRPCATSGASPPEDRLLHALPIFHTHGLFVATNVTLMAGGSLHLPAELRSPTR